MKNLLAALLITLLSGISFASGVVSSSESAKDSRYDILDLVIGVHKTYSRAAGLDASVFEIIGGDGMNPTRMILIINDGLGNKKTFELSQMMVSVSRITFLSKNEIVINFAQDDFKNISEDNYSQVIIERSIKIKLTKNNNGEMSDTVSVESLK